MKLKTVGLLSMVLFISCVCLLVYSRNSGLIGQSLRPHTTKDTLQQRVLLSHDSETLAPDEPETQHLSTTATSPMQKSGYVLTVNYNSQMTRGIRNLMGQQCWAKSMTGVSLSIVEPFSSKSRLVHYRCYWDGLKTQQLHDAVLFGKYFDLDVYNKVSLKENGAPLVKWEEFVAKNKTPRKIVALVLPSNKCNFESTSRYRRGASCAFYGKQYEELIKGLKERFDITSVERVCLDCSHIKHKLSLNELQEMIFRGDNDTSQYIVITNTWRNIIFTQSWLDIPPHCKMAESPKLSSTRLVSSSTVAQHSNLYKEKVIKSDRVVAVMFRIERYLTLGVLGKINESLDSCLEKTIQLHDRLLQKGGQEKSGTFITLDIGRFGSKLMQNNLTVAKYGQDSLTSINKLVHNLITKIYKGQFKSLEDYEDTFVEVTGGITERGYISMVQRSIATKADCLILMGGGSYQQVAISQYLANHPNPSNQCIHAVCVAENISDMLPSH